MEPDLTNPLWPDEDGQRGEDPVVPGWWSLIDGVWRWVTNPLPRTAA